MFSTSNARLLNCRWAFASVRFGAVDFLLPQGCESGRTIGDLEYPALLQNEERQDAEVARCISWVRAFFMSLPARLTASWQLPSSRRPWANFQSSFLVNFKVRLIFGSSARATLKRCRQSGSALVGGGRDVAERLNDDWSTVLDPGDEVVRTRYFDFIYLNCANCLCGT